MSDPLFDNFLKDKLGQYDSGAPMHVWERIREKEKDDPKVFFWWKRYLLAGVMLLGASVLGYLVWSAVNHNTVVSNNQKATASVNQNNNNTSAGTGNNNSKETIPNINVSETKNETEITASSVTANNIKQEQTDQLPAAGTNPAKQEDKSEQRKQINNSSNSISSFTNRQPVNSGKGGTSGAGKKRVAFKQSKTNITANTINPANDQNKSSNNYLLSVAGNAFEPKSLQPGFKAGNISQNSQRPSCPTINGPRRNDWYLEVYGSPDYTMRSFSNPSGLNNYVSYRKQNEDNRNGFSAGVRVAKNLGEKTVLKTGLNYSQINERLKIVTQNEKQITQIVTIRTVIRAPGDTLFIRDTSYFEQSGTRFRTTYNRYRFIDIPVLFSYEFGNPDLVSFAVNAGPVINVTSFYSGEVLDTLLQPVKISTETGSGVHNWRRNIGLGFIASVSVYKHINSRLQVFAEPYFRYNFKPVSQNIGIVNQRYSVSGMQLGIRYKLNNTRQRYRY